MSNVLKAVVPTLILAFGLGTAKFLVSSRKEAEKAPPEAKIAAVEYRVVTTGAPNARIRSTGVVEGSREVSLSALVSGEVVWVSPKLEPGGRFAKGAPILRVDPRDYELAVAQEEARVAQAQVELDLEVQRQNTAQREWEILGGGRDPSEAPLALRKPQLEAAQRALESARSGLQRARLNLERTTLSAPFNAMVLSETVDEGQLLSPGATVVSLVGTDRFRVEVSVPVVELAHVAVPGIGGADEGSAAWVSQDLGGAEPIRRQGRVSGLGGELEATTRTANLFVTIPDPLGGEGLPLMPGAFVEVEIEGRPLPGAAAVPRDALVDGDAVWVVTPEDTLSRRTVRVAWRDSDLVYVTSGLAAGDRLVVTPPSLPVQGAKVKPREAGADAPRAAADASPDAMEN